LTAAVKRTTIGRAFALLDSGDTNESNAVRDKRDPMTLQGSPPPAQPAAESSPASPLTRAGLEALITRHYVGLRLLITRRVGDPQLAADLLNEAVCTSWEKWQAGQIEKPELIAGYIFQVAMNLLRNHRRAVVVKLHRRLDTGEMNALEGREEAPDRDAESGLAARVRELIAGMGVARDRMILTRFYLNEEDKASICRDMGLDPAQFDKVLHRARGRLRQLLDDAGLDRGDVFSMFSVS
jgi:RNA polymerase sigma-70 factor (ECF subfamily)